LFTAGRPSLCDRLRQCVGRFPFRIYLVASLGLNASSASHKKRRLASLFILETLESRVLLTATPTADTLQPVDATASIENATTTNAPMVLLDADTTSGSTTDPNTAQPNQTETALFVSDTAESIVPIEPLATLSWTGAAGNNLWQDPLNWTGGVLPGATDAAIIGAGFSIILSSGTHTIASLQTDSQITTTGGSLTIAGTATINNTLSVSGGLLTANGTTSIQKLILAAGTFSGSGAVTVAGTTNASTWSGGALSGTGTLTVQNGVTLNVSGNATKTLARSLVNAGTLAYSGTNLVWSSASSLTLTNQSGATFNLQGNVAIKQSGGAGLLTIINNGTLRKSAGTDTAVLAAAVTNSGTIDVQSGTISLEGGGSSTGGSYTAS